MHNVREEFKIKKTEYNEFGTISLWTLPPPINSEKHNSENWSQPRYPPPYRNSEQNYKF